MLKVGDYVTVKEGTVLENGEVVNNFGGKIMSNRKIHQRKSPWKRQI